MRQLRDLEPGDVAPGSAAAAVDRALTRLARRLESIATEQADGFRAVTRELAEPVAPPRSALRLRGGHTDVRLERAGTHVVAVATAAQEVTVAVPVPEEPVVAVIAVTTASARDRDTHRRVALLVASSLRLA